MGAFKVVFSPNAKMVFDDILKILQAVDQNEFELEDYEELLEKIAEQIIENGFY